MTLLAGSLNVHGLTFPGDLPSKESTLSSSLCNRQPPKRTGRNAFYAREMLSMWCQKRMPARPLMAQTTRKGDNSDERRSRMTI